MTSSTGAVLCDPGGGVVSTATPLGYAGAYTDPETDLVDLSARYYDPATGQSMSVDPLETVTQQPYSYADDNPLNETDPLGLDGILGTGIGPNVGPNILPHPGPGCQRFG